MTIVHDILRGVATCIHCGCNDLAACPGGCSWVRVDRKRGRGVCSRCAEARKRRKTSRR